MNCKIILLESGMSLIGDLEGEEIVAKLRDALQIMVSPDGKYMMIPLLYPLNKKAKDINVGDLHIMEVFDAEDGIVETYSNMILKIRSNLVVERPKIIQ